MSTIMMLFVMMKTEREGNFMFNASKQEISNRLFQLP